MTATLEIYSQSPEETVEIGQMIAAALAPGDVVGLIGELGAGKTQLTKGLALGLGVPDSRLVNSPTFVLVNEYEGRVPVYHIDAYRLRSGGEYDGLGVEEMLLNGIVIIEWADRVAMVLPSRTIWIEIAAEEDNVRRLAILTTSPETDQRLAKLGAAG